ncbi:hypothetical protein B296_00051641 [Ensete ventricosum]|uniref:Uncharacterized protein n=1 Tax=Ensete ventricosum TaxID=4639 RepID=A0A426XYK4_ENSVE|nr:hypothetical protein B296_00051641 [Ensete ventricosum]
MAKVVSVCGTYEHNTHKWPPTGRPVPMGIAPVARWSHEATSPTRKNLITFEQCYDEVSSHVMAYASLMDCIDEIAADVALLQKRGIIVSGLGDNKEIIALLFNKLYKELAINDNECHLSSIFRDVSKHCNTRYNKVAGNAES